MPRPLRASAGAVAALGALALAACGAGAQADAPTWVPKPSFSGEGQQPGLSPVQPQPRPSATPGGGGSSGSPGPSATRSPAQDPSVVATNLTAPDAIALLPDNTALVGERTTGRIVRVQPQPGQPVPTVRTLTGLDTAGGGGLLDLALSPNYDQDNLIFAYVTTPTDNRVIDFTLTGPVTPVLTGIPRGASDNAGRIAFGDDGRLYVATGDAGRPQLAADPASLAGKILRVTDIGTPAPGNPTRTAVFARGLHLPLGLCLIPQTDVLLDLDGGDSGGDEVNVVTPGADYGWPSPTNSSAGPITTLPTGQQDPGGCAVQDGTVFVTTKQGRALLSAKLTLKAGAVSTSGFLTSLTGKYGRLATVVAAPDGALWLTTSNRDGAGKPVPTDERVLRIVPSGGSAQFPG